MTARLQPGARAVRAKPRASPIVHIHGDENYWGDLLSRWVMRPGGAVCVHASVKYTEVLFAGSDKFPTKDVMNGVQTAAAEGGPTLDTALGLASLDSEGLNRVEHYGHRLIWAPARAESLKKRLLVCAHLEGTGHLQRWLGLSCAACGRVLADDVRDMTRLCGYCADTKAGALVPCTLEETPHGREPNVVVHLGYLYMGEGAVGAGIGTVDGIQYVLVVLEDLSGYTWL